MASASVDEDEDVAEDTTAEPAAAVALLGTLPEALAALQHDRQATFARRCVFCPAPLAGSRADVLLHLGQAHDLKLGHPDHLVFLDRLLDQMEATVAALQCIYCRRVFRDRALLKTHMRKKSHFRLHPDDQTYDKFFVANYLEPGRGWRSQRQDGAIGAVESAGLLEDNDEDDDEEEEEGEETWDDWTDADAALCRCLFCPMVLPGAAECAAHMAAAHHFILARAISDFEYYDRVRLINFIRSQTARFHCCFCGHAGGDAEDLAAHLAGAAHDTTQLARDFAAHDEFLYAVVEGDPLLCILDNEDDEEEEEAKEK